MTKQAFRDAAFEALYSMRFETLMTVLTPGGPNDCTGLTTEACNRLADRVADRMSTEVPCPQDRWQREQAVGHVMRLLEVVDVTGIPPGNMDAVVDIMEWTRRENRELARLEHEAAQKGRG